MATGQLLQPTVPWKLSAAAGIVWGMRVTRGHLDRIPPRNMRIPVRDFARVWLTAEIRDDEMAAANLAEDGYLRGVCATCEWMAGLIVTVREDGRPPASFYRPSPLTGMQVKAYEELIAAETVEAERVAAGSEPGEPDFVDGVLATLLWAWRGTGPQPIETKRSQTV
jgi:hypothetical protein